MKQSPKNIAIVGSGLVGSLLAIYLRSFGHSITVFDRRPDIRTVKFSGRSINLAMSDRGWKSLREVGIEDEIKKIAIPLDKRAMHVLDRPLYFQKYGKEGEAIWSISRGVLNRKMIDLAEQAGVVFKFNEKVWDVDLPTASLFTGESEKSEWKEYAYDLIFGCDGAFSRIRHKMQRRSRFDYSQDFLDVGYKELTIPANPDGSYKLDKHSFHIWPRGSFMFIAMPNMDGSFTCTLFLPFEGEVSFDKIKTKKDATTFFTRYFPNIMPDIENLMQDFFKNPTSAMVTMKCYPWTYWDKVALIGDSAHAIVPFYGQGMNAGFEDIFVLSRIMKTYGDDWEAIEELKFTFNVDRDTMHFERHWVWNTKTHEVTGISRGDTITYNRKAVDSTEARADAAFINDKYWLLAPINLLWDEKSITYTYDERSLAPISNDSLPKLTIVYGNEGGYTPGDAYDFYLADDYRIKEWVFRKGNGPEPSSVTTWEGYEQIEGLVISKMHKNKEGNFKLYFTGVAATSAKN